MPRRPETHRTGDLAVEAIKHEIPIEWVVREKDKDYGIDLEVEVFDKDNATGDMFYVQAKGTKNKNKTVSLQIKIETINYWRAMGYPVFLFVHQQEYGKLFYIWSSEINTEGIPPSQKSITIKLSSANEFVPQTIERLRRISRAFRGRREQSSTQPIPLILDANVNSALSARQKVVLNQIIDPIKLLRRADVSDDFGVVVSVVGKLVTASLFEAFKSSIEIEEDDKSHLPDIIVAAICMCLSHADLTEHSRSVAEQIALQKLHMLNDTTAAMVAGELLHSIPDAIDFALKHDLHTSSFASTIFSMKLFKSQHRSDENLNHVERFYRTSLTYLSKVGGDAPVGEAHFNVGNILQTKGDNREAVRSYIQALRQNDRYLKRAHFWQFFGTALYDLRKFQCAVFAYRKAYDLEPNGERCLYLADALLRNGEFKEAQLHYNLAVDTLKDRRVHWAYLLHSLSGSLKDEVGAVCRRNRVGAASIWATQADKNARDYLDVSIRIRKNFDPIDPLACYNIGISEARNGNNDSALFAFICTLIEQPFDVECWQNAVLSAFNMKNNNLFISVLTAANDHVGESLRARIASSESKKELPDGFTDMIDTFQAIQAEAGGDLEKSSTAAGLRIWFD